MKNRYRIVVILILISVSSTAVILFLQPGTKLSRSEIGHAASLLFNMNHFKLELPDKLEKDKISIFWNGKNIFTNGHFNYMTIYRQRFIYGPNIFIIKYNSEFLGEVTQYKFNNWHYHKYTFRINLANNKLTPELEIIGPDDSVHWATSYNLLDS